MRYFDLHCDTITECTLQKKSLRENDLHISLKRAEQYRPWAQVFAVWIPDNLRGDAAYARFEECAVVFEREMDANRETIRFCRSGADLEKTVQADCNAAFLSIEGGAALMGDISKLDAVYDRGVRLITLTWNGRNELGDGCGEENAGGLTPFGREAVRRMAELGMIVDVSHLSVRGFDDVASVIKGAFVASHSNTYAFCDHPRNLRDDQIHEIIRRRGLIGLNLYPPFIGKSEKIELRDLLPHVEHILALGGQDVLSVGADFDGADMPMDVSGIESMTNLHRLLVSSFGESLADKIFYQNAFDFFKGLPGNSR